MTKLRNVCIFVLAYAVFFRIQEFLHIKYGDIHFHSGYVVINVDISKTDQLRKGNEVVISVGLGEKTCPVKILRRYLTEVNAIPSNQIILFVELCVNISLATSLLQLIGQLVIHNQGIF